MSSNDASATPNTTEKLAEAIVKVVEVNTPTNQKTYKAARDTWVKETNANDDLLNRKRRPTSFD